MRSRRNRRGQGSQIRSLVERLKALEDSDFFSPVATAEPVIPTVVAAGRSWGVICWFSMGFACACIAGGIALLAAVTETRGKEAAASRSGVEFAALPAGWA